jgi:glycosyltransferase involved in cell wall biosynthesis
MLEREGLRPSVIHAHKFAFEGTAGLHLARRLGDDVALFVSVRGEAESKVLRYKPHYLPQLQQIADRAERIYYVSAWFRPILDSRLSIDPEKEVLLPNIVGNARADIPARDPDPRFVCVLNLRIRRRKGLDHLLQAFRTFHARHPGIGLDVIGDGDAEGIAAVEAQIARLGLEGRVRLLGKMDNAALTEVLPDYLALLLPSFNETFGMVYVEALFAGIPILYGRNTGIDGYLDGIDAGVAATPGDVAEIEAGIERLFADNGAYRAAIGRNAATLHARFDAEAVLGRYRDDLLACTAKSR